MVVVVPAVVTSISLDVTPAKPDAVKRRVRLPGTPEIERSVKAARPEASVVLRVEPPRSPPPEPIAADT
jgi:hypothetical protein